MEKTKPTELRQEIELSEGINANIEGKFIILKKEDKEIKRKLNPIINTKIEGNKLILSATKINKTTKKMFGTMKAHINNMIRGLTEGFKYELKVANVHFPMNVSYDKATNELIVKNFLGEKKDRKIKLVDNINVKIDKDTIEINSYDIEKAGQAATNIEKGAKVRNKDRRVFQDGIFITEKPRRKFI